MGDPYSLSARPRLALPQVTLCAATSVNLPATVRALEACLSQIEFAACKLFTDAKVRPSHREIQVVPIAPLRSSADYSDFVLKQMVDHVETAHCLIVQWDGHVLNAARWQAAFLEYDYIGARWPHYGDGHDVGNGGFSLRSRQLMLVCREPEFQTGAVEDKAIGRVNRDWLEKKGMRFAPAELADRFATERASDLAVSFGYHGVFNMPRAIGVERFWDIYLGLDDRRTVGPDLWAIAREVGSGSGGISRLARIICDRIKSLISSKAPA